MHVSAVDYCIFTMKTPLKTILKNFLDHIEDLESRQKLYDDQYEVEFQELKKLTDKLKDDPAYQCSVGLKDVNRPKNRYKDIVPYDSSRVILPKHEGIPGSDYINASYIKGASGALAYIAAQGPLPNTVIDFWRMIWVCDVQVIVMACNEREAGKYKCEAYFPGPGEIKQYGNISIELVRASQVCPDFLVRTLLVKCGSEMRDVYQFHYTSWPDHGVPDSVQPILDLVRLMRDCQASETVPIVVHCSAGCGRTGTLCAVDYVWACLRHGKLNEDFSLFQIALELRRQRIAMIQTKEQYILAHKAVAAMFEQQLRVIDCHIYENLDEDGEPLIWKEVGKDREFEVPDFMIKPDTKEKKELTLTGVNKPAAENKSILDLHMIEKTQESKADNLSCNSSTDHNFNMKANASNCVDTSRRNSESSYSRNSILSQHSNEDSIPFIDEDDVSIRPNCGRAYLNMPSCDSISKLVDCFDPFADKVSSGTDDSSPDGDPAMINNKMNDFQSDPSCKTLDKNAKFSTFKDSKCVGKNETKPTDLKSDIDTTNKASFLNRGSYPPSNIEKFNKNPVDVDKNSEEIKNEKKVGKATVVRRPSISKLKAFFEKSGISSQRTSNEGSKRVLFRNNSHHVARADSAPPSLDCMDRSSAVEKESILKMVTRKFRSSSVRTEREMQSKQFDKCLNRKSATDTMKDGLNALTRTMSFSINKTFKSYSPAKRKSENVDKVSSSNFSESVAGIYKPKSPDQITGNSMWYDKASLPRAVAVVKPTGKFDSNVCTKPAVSRTPSDPQSPDKNKTQEASFAYMSKPAKLKDFFSNLNKKDAKDPTTFWYNNESNSEIDLNFDKNNLDVMSKSDNGANVFTKSTSKVLPFLPIVPWKKVGQKSPLSSPDSPKNSTFYTNVTENSVNVNLPNEKTTDLPKCPIPEEIIHLDPVKNSFWPSSAVSTSSVQSNNSENSNCNILVNKDNTPQTSVNNELPKNDFDQKEENVISKHSENTELSITKPDSEMNITADTRPAIPKKTVIGRNKILQNAPLDKTTDLQSASEHTQISEGLTKNNGEKKLPNEQNMQHNTVVEKNDLYINVNIKAMKNIEQIENTLRKNPRGAIIDLTSRESYSMEEELVNAVNQLSEPAEKTKEPSFTKDEFKEKPKMLSVKNNSKFPGYEVIWPEQSCVPIQKSKSSSKVPLMSNTKMIDKNIEFILSNQHKTGLCYSPPLRRSINANMALSKSQSCGNLDWAEGEDPISNLKEQSNTPTKRLVNEAVVELNTLLNQLTTRTLSEDVDFDAKSKEKPSDKNAQEKPVVNTEANNIVPNDTVVDSVTLVTKSYNSGSSPREEEIVFHFPPPPRGPPPPNEETPVESYNVIKKGRCLVLNKSSDSDSAEKPVCSNKKSFKMIKGGSSSTNSSESSFEETSLSKCPQPAPRKSKQSVGLRRSSSYTNIVPPQSKNKGYENVFLEKYQTLSRLEIKQDFDEQKTDKSGPFQKSPLVSKSAKMALNYANIGATHAAEPLISPKVKPEISEKKKEISKNTSPFNGVTNNQGSFDKFKMMLDENKADGNSVYGKIYKTSDKKAQATEICAGNSLVQNLNDVKRKPVHSKKMERAPPPPNVKPVQTVDNEMIVKTNPNSSLIPKKLPSRKLEKAPPPPHLLQKSSSTANVPKKNVQSTYTNFPPAHHVEEKPKLPAVHENVPNISDATQVINKKINPSVSPHKFVNRGLSHSQSDVSVYLALKERKMQNANQERKILNIKSLLVNKKTKTDAANVSSSDSDSSYEKIFLTKCDQAGKTISQGASKEKIEQISIKSYRKEVPVAPPRSKRRSTTEVQYTKVKAKDASHISSTSQALRGFETKNSKINCSIVVEDDPPAIPVKTKDAFEIPGEISNDANKKK